MSISIKYQNHVYLSICHLLYCQFKKTHYNSFTAFCCNLRDKINDETLTITEKKKLIVFIQDLLYDLDEIYSLGRESGFIFLNEFLIQEKYIVFGKAMAYFCNKVDFNKSI
jgi:hypothetical protein